MQELLTIGIVGTALALLVQFIKNKFGADGIKAQAITIGLSIVIGTVYVFFKDTSWWQTVLAILSSATTVWAFILRKK